MTARSSSSHGVPSVMRRTRTVTRARLILSLVSSFSLAISRCLFEKQPTNPAIFFRVTDCLNIRDNQVSTLVTLVIEACRGAPRDATLSTTEQSQSKPSLRYCIWSRRGFRSKRRVYSRRRCAKIVGLGVEDSPELRLSFPLRSHGGQSERRLESPSPSCSALGEA
jgi:hypothetical protein